MKWQGRRRSKNVEDRRGQGAFGTGRRRGGMRMPSGRAARGGGGGLIMLLVIVGVSWLLGINPMTLLSGGTGTSGGYSLGPSENRPLPNAGEDEVLDFISVNLAETEDLWSQIFAQNGLNYTPTKLVVFDGQTQSSCGVASARTGPFYCPVDQSIYLDPAFFVQLRDQFSVEGDFAYAYVIAHEVGHHVQQLVGTLPNFNEKRRMMRQDEENAYSVKVELQADCYAGIWANYVGEENLLERGDIMEALNAAEQIGDDAIQKRTQGYVVPKNFNHGTSAQRQEWFSRGYESGDVGACDTGVGPN